LTTEEAVGSGLPYIKVQTKDQAYSDMSIPCIVVYPSSATDEELQLGGGYWLAWLYNFDIYAQSDGQLLEIVDLVREFVQSPTSILRYDQYWPSYQVLDGLVRSIYSGGEPALVCQGFFENRTVNFFDRFNTIGEMKAHTAQVSTVISIPSC
jgi:hypothetical protein